MQLGALPTPTYVDPDGGRRSLNPVVPPNGEWVGVVTEEGLLLRWDANTGAALASVHLPTSASGEKATEAHWQVVAGAEGRLAVARDINSMRALFIGDVSGKNWKRSPAPMVRFNQQSGAWLSKHWLITEPEKGVFLIDPATGQVTASFTPPPLPLQRLSPPLPSPDFSQIFLKASDWPTDEFGGLYLLDARTLAVLRHWPAEHKLLPHDFEWDGNDVVMGPEGLNVAKRSRLSLLTGITPEPSANPHFLGVGDLHMGAQWVRSLFEGRALLAAKPAVPPTVAGVVAGGSFLENPDGTVWCEGHGCDVFRCVASPQSASPSTDPACAALITHL